MRLPKVSVVIPCKNVEGIISNCVESILNNNYPKELLEIVIIDDGCTDSTVHIVKKYSVRVIVHNRNLGRAKALNSGVFNAKGEITVFTNADCVAERDWIRRLVLRYSDDSVAGVGGRVINPKTSNPFLEFFRRLRYLEYNGDVPETSAPLPMSNVSYRRDVLLQVGGFDEDLRESGEDQDIWVRVREKGYRVLYEKDAVVFHNHPTIDVRSFSRWWWIRGREFPRWLRKNPTRIQIKYRTALLVPSLPTYICLILILGTILSSFWGWTMMLLVSSPIVIYSAFLALSSHLHENRREGNRLMTIKIQRFDLSELGAIEFVSMVMVGLLASIAFTAGKLVGALKYRFLIL